MARKTNDLLEVFRPRPPEEEPAQPKAARRTRKGGRAEGGFRGLLLERRHLLLGSSALLLLIALTFVLGLAAGRPAGGGGTAALQRASAERWMIVGSLPTLDPATQQPVQPARVAKALSEQFSVPPANIRIWVADRRLQIGVGPFGSQDRAQDYLRRSQLEMAHLHGEDPFLRARLVPWKAE